MKLDKNQQAFLTLLKAGLWEKEARLLSSDGVDFTCVYKLAQGQSVAGLVAAGLERAVDFKVPQADAWAFGGYALHLEHRNRAMNEFVAWLIGMLRAGGVNAVLVKGQGIAQCYNRPLWRAPGDVDLLLDADDYEKAKRLLIPMATRVESEFTFMKHVGMTLNGWVVELHGTMHSRLSRRIDNEIDKVQEGVLLRGEVRVWHNGDADVYLPAPDADVIFVFTHFLHHFFLEGVGLRQICDWCRLLWTFRDSLDCELLSRRLLEAGLMSEWRASAGEIDVALLERRLRAMGLMSEWRAFAALAVDWLGMPADAMPLYCGDGRWHRKGDRILADVLAKGNFGRNESASRPEKQRPYLLRKFVSAGRHLRELLRHFLIFPKDSVAFFTQVLRTGLNAAFRGE